MSTKDIIYVQLHCQWFLIWNIFVSLLSFHFPNSILCIQFSFCGQYLVSSYYKLVQCWDQCRCGDRADADHANINRHWAGFYAATPATMPLCQAATVPFDLVFRPPLSVNDIADCQGINKSFTALGLGSFQCLMTLFLYLWAAPFSAWR